MQKERRNGRGKKLTSETNRDAADRRREGEPDKQSGVSLHIRVSEVWMPSQWFLTKIFC